ncbi:16137_t:CDS:1, partial [Racocetra fulgida]
LYSSENAKSQLNKRESVQEKSKCSKRQRTFLEMSRRKTCF